MQKKATWECDYEGQGTDKVRCWVLTICWNESILVSSAICVYFVQYTHILDANCEGQSDSQSNGHRVGSLNLKITYLICAKYILSIFFCIIWYAILSILCSQSFILFADILFIVNVAVCSCQERFMRMWHYCFSWCDVAFCIS